MNGGLGDGAPQRSREAAQIRNAQRSTGRRFAIAVAALIAYIAINALSLLLIALLGRMLLPAWGLNGQLTPDSPEWAQTPYRVLAAGTMLLGTLATIGATKALRRAATGTWRTPRGSGALVWGFAGLAVGVVTVVALRVMDAIRWGWPLSEPHGSLPVLLGALVVLLMSISRELFFRDFLMTLFDGMRDWVAIAVSAAIYTLMSSGVLQGALNPVMLLNCALLGVITALLYRRMGGIRASVAFCAAQDILFFSVMGLPDASMALYESYPVQWPFMSGGAAGPMNGLVMTVLLLGIGALLVGAMRGARRAA